MRKAELRVRDAAKKGKAEVVFFQFGPGGAGGTQANVDRWFGQFQEPRDKIHSKVEEVTVRGHKVTYVQAEGTYQSYERTVSKKLVTSSRRGGEGAAEGGLAGESRLSCRTRARPAATAPPTGAPPLVLHAVAEENIETSYWNSAVMPV